MKIILCRFPNEKDARHVANILLEEEIVACVQIQGPIQSIYKWNGKMVCEEEWKISLKAKDENVERAHQIVLKKHTYENPQWIVINATGSKAYEDWVAEK